jgi:dolichol-phosphate mannosyltransferase
MDVLYIVIPAYNEGENIENVVNDWYPVIEKCNGGGRSRLVIMDDGSKDDTYGLVLKLTESKPLLEVVHKDNSGHGATVLYGYHYALKKNADYIFQTDADGQTLSEEFQQFWNLRHKYDMIIGLRNKRQDGLSRIVVTKTLKWVIKACFGVTVLDANTPYRLMTASSLKQVIKDVPTDFNLSNVLISVIYIKKQKKVKYIPITFRPRQGGKNSINLKKIFMIGEKALGDFIKINREI